MLAGTRPFTANLLDTPVRASYKNEEARIRFIE